MKNSYAVHYVAQLRTKVDGLLEEQGVQLAANRQLTEKIEDLDSQLVDVIVERNSAVEARKLEQGGNDMQLEKKRKRAGKMNTKQFDDVRAIMGGNHETLGLLVSSVSSLCL